MGERYVDAILCGLQVALTKIKALRFGPLSVRLGMARSRAITKDKRQKGAAVAKIIEFYVPDSFRRREKWVPPQNRGKILEFPLPTTKSA
jgi:hypothetical protein